MLSHDRAHGNISAGEAAIRAQIVPYAGLLSQYGQIGRVIRLGSFCGLRDVIMRMYSRTSHVFSSFRQCAISSSANTFQRPKLEDNSPVDTLTA